MDKKGQMESFELCTNVHLLYIFTSTWLSSAQTSFIQKFQLDFCNKILITHSVLARSKIQETQNFLKKKCSVSISISLIFSASFAFYSLVLYTQSQTSKAISCNIEMLNSGANLPLYTSFIKSEIVIATFMNLLNMAVLKKHLNKMNMEKVG